MVPKFAQNSCSFRMRIRLHVFLKKEWKTEEMRSKREAEKVGTLYHKLGGVYPISQFADRLVELVLPQGCRIRLPPNFCPL